MTNALLNKLIIFDCDGVLVDSEYIACRIEAEEFSKMGYVITVEEDIRRFAGKSQKDVFATVEQELGKKLPDNFDALLEAQIIKALAEQLQPINGIDAVLPELPNKCVASSGTMEKIHNSLRVTGLNKYFPDDQIFSATMVTRGKPAPDLFLLAARKLGFEPYNCIVVEDSVSGVAAGKAAGMKVLGFVGGSHILDDAHQTILKNAGADIIFKDMRQLINWINKV
jgi:HAD superfamily hydrolase (TIGR01509 family)